MKTTLDLPDALMRRVKIRAASESRKLKDLIAELLEKGLAEAPAPLPAGEPPYRIDSETGFPVARRVGTAPGKKVSLEEALAAAEQASEREALSHAGNPR